MSSKGEVALRVVCPARGAAERCAGRVRLQGAAKRLTFDLARGAKVSGSGFPVYRGDGSALQRALISWFLDVHTREHGMTEIWPPAVVNAASAIGTGQIPDKEDQMYVVTRDELYLVPTAEVPVTNLHRDEILEAGGVRCYRLHGPSVPTQKPYRFMLATRSSSRIVAHERPDLIEVGSTWFAPWLVHLATRRIDLPVVWFYHSNFPRIVAPWPERAKGCRPAAGRKSRATFPGRFSRACGRGSRTFLCHRSADLR